MPVPTSTRGRTINGLQVDAELWALYSAAVNSGGKVWLATVAMPELAGACANCGGIRQMFLQQVVGGPFEAVIAPQHGVSNVYDEKSGRWYHVRTRQYPCPKCDPRHKPLDL